LRVGYRRRVFAALVRGVIGASSPFDTLEVLSRLADDVLRRGLSIAAAEVLPVPLGAAEMPVAVIALGRLGTSEFDVNSDADLVFLADPALTPEDREPWRRIFERFVHLLGSHTKDGLLFPVDTRLRPRGGESDLLQSTAYLLDYCRAEARAWEAVTWLKARPVAGNFELGTAAIRDVRQILAERFSEPGALAADLAGTRQRLEDEAAANRGKGEFKKRAGGFYDVEYLLAFYFLCRGAAPLAAHTVRQIAALESAGVLDSATAQELRAAAFLYRAVDHAVRLITGHSARAVPEPALAARIAALFEAWRLPLPGAAGTPAERILGALAGTAERLRELYRRVLLQRAVPAAGPDGTRGSSGGTAGKVS
jgi:glutamate-ammonia-ligase adenylyltransferase